jgi:hypothetical protein
MSADKVYAITLLIKRQLQLAPSVGMVRHALTPADEPVRVEIDESFAMNGDGRHADCQETPDGM